ncbi:ABC transporter permease [Heyndrickxia sporothermodurans]|uniref:ABC transporter permease n=1 Tax=Heyndrickxia sporothermodurans TaxID=46224 RepID=A0AB37HJ72_9BACI|nr:ABC transporter permease [Heyndrickxia sporothermodurans]MBL5767573.1 ABC transporter permease [Heyndrickxia sporothermodurans]MBL5770553.1 ABC transporter permease [Heyndrickxia sporothermodurans]MBL5774242.1 ABC transporter permease [Heyndrickxia sporothermodurans]MBL5777706.1 ABC transporter permease [Heyndrickxia sporothermodurans]MBL5781476.1 ABC transporter permease [Heyndrickxia sporothermodurans]
MNRFGIMLGHAYMSKLKSKSFIITTVIMLIGVLILGNMNRIIDLFSGGDTKDKIAVIDESSTVFDPLQQQLKSINKDIQLIKVDKSEADLQKAVNNKKYKAYLIISLDQSKLPKAVYKAPTLTNTELSGQLAQALQTVKASMAAAQLNLSADKLALLNSPVAFKEVSLENNAKSAEELAQARGLVYILLFAIYFSVIFYASMVGMEIATEKASRVMEILISSASPTQQMFAKIIGGALLGLTQMAFLLAVAYFTIKQNLGEMEGGFFEFFGFSDIKASTIIYAIVFFLLGYLLFATLAAFLGSLVSRIEDAQQMMMPMTFIVMIGFFIAMSGLNNPSAGFVTVTSYIPFFTPMIMFLRVGMLDLPLWVGLSGVAVLIISIIIMAIIGARIYRGGVLMYGKSNSLKNIKKALQLSKNE